MPVESERCADFEVWLDTRSWPFTILRVGTDGVLLDFSRDYPHAIESSYWLSRQDLVEVSVRRGYSIAKIDFRHDSPLLPKRIRLIADSPDPIVRSLREFGYEVVELRDSWSGRMGTWVTHSLSAAYRRLSAAGLGRKR